MPTMAMADMVDMDTVDTEDTVDTVESVKPKLPQLHTTVDMVGTDMVDTVDTDMVDTVESVKPNHTTDMVVMVDMADTEDTDTASKRITICILPNFISAPFNLESFNKIQDNMFSATCDYTKFVTKFKN